LAPPSLPPCTVLPILLLLFFPIDQADADADVAVAMVATRGCGWSRTLLLVVVVVNIFLPDGRRPT
jgi:hypothetical protein